MTNYNPFSLADTKKHFVLLRTTRKFVLWSDIVDNFDSTISVDSKHFDDCDIYIPPFYYNDDCKHFSTYIEKNFGDKMEVIEGEIDLCSPLSITVQIQNIVINFNKQ